MERDFYLSKVVGEGLSEQVVFEKVIGGVEHSRQRRIKCKGPEVGTSLPCWRR